MTIDQGVQSGTRNERSWFGRYGWVIFGFTMTVAYLVLVLWGLTYPNPFVENASTFEDLWNPTAKLAWNAFGDFLAGLFAPLAFLWLFTATMIQSQELALQRQELVDNRTVAKAQADEARKQAEYIGEQTVILKANAARENMRLADARTAVRVTSLMEWIENALPSELPLAAGRIVSNSSLVTRASGARRFAIFAKSLVGLRESIVVENCSECSQERMGSTRAIPSGA